MDGSSKKWQFKTFVVEWFFARQQRIVSHSVMEKVVNEWKVFFKTSVIIQWHEDKPFNIGLVVCIKYNSKMRVSNLGLQFIERSLVIHALPLAWPVSKTGFGISATRFAAASNLPTSTKRMKNCSDENSKLVNSNPAFFPSSQLFNSEQD